MSNSKEVAITAYYEPTTNELKHFEFPLQFFVHLLESQGLKVVSKNNESTEAENTKLREQLRAALEAISMAERMRSKLDTRIAEQRGTLAGLQRSYDEQKRRTEYYKSIAKRAEDQSKAVADNAKELQLTKAELQKSEDFRLTSTEELKKQVRAKNEEIEHWKTQVRLLTVVEYTKEAQAVLNAMSQVDLCTFNRISGSNNDSSVGHYIGCGWTNHKAAEAEVAHRESCKAALAKVKL